MTTALKMLAGLALSCLCLVVISGCGSNSEITHSYVDPLLKKRDLQGVLVVGVSQNPDARAGFEEAFTRALVHRGVNAKVSYPLAPGKKPSAEKIIAAAEEAGVDTILVTRYVGKSTEDVYHPGTVYYGVAPAYGAGYYGGFGSYYGHVYEVAYQQPVWTANVTHTVISDLYIAQTKEHMWQAVSDTIQASSTAKARDDAIHSLIGNLKDQGLLN